MKNKHRVTKLKGIKVVSEHKKWQTPMKPRIPVTKTHKDPRFPSRQDLKQALKSQIDSFQDL